MGTPNHRNEKGERPPSFGMNDTIPPAFMERITQFVLDRRTGNIQLNIKNGEILGLHIEEIIALKQ